MKNDSILMHCIGGYCDPCILGSIAPPGRARDPSRRYGSVTKFMLDYHDKNYPHISLFFSTFVSHVACYFDTI